MICLQCGTKNPDGAKFCSICGAAMKAWTKDEPQAEKQQIETQQPQRPSQAQSPEPKRAGKNRGGKIALVIALIAAAGACAFFAYRHFKGDAVERAEAKYPIELSIDAPKYSEAATPVPIRIVGTTADGEEVDQTVLVGGVSNLSSLELPAGEYTLEVISSPILEDGTIFRKPEALIPISIVETNNGQATVTAGPAGNQKQTTVTAVEEEESTQTSASANAGNTTSGTTKTAPVAEITFEPVKDMREITQEQIDETVQHLIDAGYEQEKAEAFRDAAEHKVEEVKENWEEDHREYTAEITIKAPGYDNASSSPIPARIIGEDFEGNEVDEKFLVGTEDGRQPTLLRGTYEMEILAPPILADGSTFKESEEKIQIIIDRAEDAADTDILVSAELKLEPADMADVTEAQLQKTHDMLLECGYDPAKAKAFLEKALQNKAHSSTKNKAAHEAYDEVIAYWTTTMVPSKPDDAVDGYNGNKFSLTDGTGTSVGSGFGWADYTNAGYAYTDINQDGVDELIIGVPYQYTDEEVFEPKWVYIYNDEKKTAQCMIHVAELRGAVSLKKDGSIWCWSSTASGMSTVTEYRMDAKGLGLVEIDVYDGMRDADPMKPENYYGKDGTAYPAKEFLENMNKDLIEMDYTLFADLNSEQSEEAATGYTDEQLARMAMETYFKKHPSDNSGRLVVYVYSNTGGGSLTGDGKWEKWNGEMGYLEGDSVTVEIKDLTMVQNGGTGVLGRFWLDRNGQGRDMFDKKIDLVNTSWED